MYPELGLATLRAHQGVGRDSVKVGVDPSLAGRRRRDGARDQPKGADDLEINVAEADHTPPVGAELDRIAAGLAGHQPHLHHRLAGLEPLGQPIRQQQPQAPATGVLKV